MKKIPCVFKRTFEGRNKETLLPDVTPGCEWVLAGEGIATRKRDGTACMVRDDRLYRRYDAKRGKTPPPGFEPCQEPDPVTGHWPGWVEVPQLTDGPSQYVWHQLAWWRQIANNGPLADGTYELCGPAFSGNPEHLDHHKFIPHGEPIGELLEDRGRSQEYMRQMLEDLPIEGVVFHHPDGRMAKITRHNFGLAWPVATPDRL